MGMSAVLSKNFDVAAKLFSLSLKVVDTEDLRAKLASLNSGGNSFSERLITESKIKNSISLALKAASEEKWEDALKHGIDATDLDEKNIASHIALAEIQLKRGYIQSAVSTIKKIRITNPKDTRILPILVDVYLKAFMFDDVKMEMAQISSPTFVNSYEYSKFMARYYEAINNNLLALRWYIETTNRYPIDDDSYYSIAKIYLAGRKFANCKQLASKAIQLNPNELNYHLLYANVLYELDNVDTAIGYLRDLEKTFPENNRLTSNIAIFYYKSGQQKNFDKYREQLFKLSNIDPMFYKFLTEEAMKMDKDEDVTTYSFEYLKRSTQDFEMRMSLAKYFYDKNQFPAAFLHLKEILNRLPSFPNLHSLMAETFLKQNDLIKAKASAEEEIKLNPSNDIGYVVLAKVFMLEKNYVEASKFSEKALRINAKNVEGLLLLGKIKLLQNYNEQAKSMFEKAQKIEQNNPEVHKELGNVYKAIGQSTLAIESFKVYLDLRPDAPDRAQIEQIMNMLK
jgi:tetratricopeptide (TPR) repeat protein